MPKRCQRPVSSQRLSHFKARRPATNATSAPSKVRNATEPSAAPPLACLRRITSRMTTGGVSTTASAKLKSSARSLATPSNMPGGIVALERKRILKNADTPSPPKEHDDGEHGACVEHHQKQCHRRRGGIQAQQLLGDDHMGRA